MQLTKNFNKIEFESRDGEVMNDNILANIQLLALNLQKIRNNIHEPLRITSGYRSPSHNSKIGGVQNSQHILGKAADIVAQNYNSKQLAVIIEKLILQGMVKEGGVGLYNGFVHYDIRGRRFRWNKSSIYKDFF